MNQVHIIGNIGQAPQITTTKTGKRVGRFAIAINSYAKSKEQTPKPPTWIPCELWETTLERLLTCQGKGSLVGRKIFRFDCRERILKKSKPGNGDHFCQSQINFKVQSFELLGALNAEKKQSQMEEEEAVMAS